MASIRSEVVNGSTSWLASSAFSSGTVSGSGRSGSPDPMIPFRP